MVSPPLNTPLLPGAQTPAQAANLRTTNMYNTQATMASKSGGKRRRSRMNKKGGQNMPVQIVPSRTSSTMAPSLGTNSSQVNIYKSGNQMTVQGQGDQVPLIPAPTKGGKKMRKSRKTRKSKKSRKSRKSRK